MVLTSSLMARMSGVTSVSKRVRATISSERAMLAAAMSMALAGLPLVAVGCGDGDDLVSVGGDALTMEGGSGDAALTDVDGVFGGDEAFAEQDLHAADGALLDEVLGVGDEDLLDVAGVVEEDDGCAHETVVGDVAVGLEEVFEEPDGVAELDPGPEHVEGQREAEAGDLLGDSGCGGRCRGLV